MSDLQKIEAVLQVFGVSYEKHATVDGVIYLSYAEMELIFNYDDELVEVRK